MQAIGLGYLGSLAEARAVVRASFAPEAFAPTDITGWDEAYTQLKKVMK